MPRPDPRAPGADQDSMFEELPRAIARRKGRHSQAVEDAIAAAHEAELVTAADGAALAALRVSAWAFDEFEASNKPYGPAKLLPGYMEALRELHMTPEARRALEGLADDKLAEFLADLADPS